MVSIKLCIILISLAIFQIIEAAGPSTPNGHRPSGGPRGVIRRRRRIVRAGMVPPRNLYQELFANMVVVPPATPEQQQGAWDLFNLGDQTPGTQLHAVPPTAVQDNATVYPTGTLLPINLFPETPEIEQQVQE